MKISKIKLAIVLFVVTGCGKDFLERKPNTDIIVPNSLDDFQEMLDNPGLNRTSALPQLSCDDYYIISEKDWLGTFTATERNAYVWAEDVFGGEVDRQEWSEPYKSVLYANAILEGLNDIPVNGNRSQYNSIKGQAHFVRAWSFFDIAKNWAPPYDENSASIDLGIPLKLSPNVNEIVGRASVKETYEQIISDLQIAVELLEPVVPPVHRNRASKPAAYALFSRLFLSMRKYEKAELYADSCLALYDKIINYNTVDTNSATPFSDTNDESIFYATQVGTGYGHALPSLRSSNINIDTVLLESYHENDLRRKVYFVTDPVSGLTQSKKRYAASGFNTYSGLATDEVFLIKAECAARRDDVSTAMGYLNALLVNRYASGRFVPEVAASSQDALKLIIKERRKELVWRCNLRWDDIRRLNKEGAEITLTRRLGDKTYILAPNSPRYTFNIPEDEIARSGIRQNAR